MGTINLLIANANNAFTTDETTIFHHAAQAAEDFIAARFVFDHEIDIVIATPSDFVSTIPEDGISGRTFNSRLIMLVIDTQQTPVTEDSVFETICHEMSHALRWEYLAEYADTLFKAMIMEGLAVILEEQAISDTGRRTKQFFLTTIQETDEAVIQNVMTQLQDDFDNKTYDYNTVFFTGNDSLPRWAGYRLGYYLVKTYLNKTSDTIYQATLASYDIFNK